MAKPEPTEAASPTPGGGAARRFLASMRRGAGTGDRGATAARVRAFRPGSGDAAPESFRGARLIDEDLSGIDLSGIDLSGADLSRANLTGTRLVGARLSGARLFECDLTGSELLGARLEGADLTECRAARTGFGNADLRGAILFHAHLRGASFTHADLRGADLRAVDAENARLRDADLREANLTQAALRGADLENVRVDGASFENADLRRARPRGMSGYQRAGWVGADILDVDFCGSYLLRRTIMDQNYLHEFRAQSRLSAAIYWAWWATSDCGRSFLRWGLWTAFLVVAFAAMFRGVDVDYGRHPTPLSSLYYSVVTLTTLGYGDVVPASAGAQILAMAEVVLGYIMLGGLLSIFANKMARRAD